MSLQNHHHVSSDTIKLQVRYSESPVSLITAAAIIEEKIRNCLLLLGEYRYVRVSSAPAQAKFILLSQNKIRNLRIRVQTIHSRKEIFLIEAEVARLYWRAVSTICSAGSDWRRQYPGAEDFLNILLNTGYLKLARKGMDAILKAGLLPEIGILHGNNSSDPLVYDFIESFRHTMVDAAIIPFFSRREIFQSTYSKREMAYGFSLLENKLRRRQLYKNRCEEFDRILWKEAVKLRNAICLGVTWRPHQYAWSQIWRCK